MTANGVTDELASFWLAGQAWPNVNIVAIRRGRRARGLARSCRVPAAQRAEVRELHDLITGLKPQKPKEKRR